MNKSFLSKEPVKKIYWAMLIVFILSMLPILYLSRYIVPCLDDYYFGIMPRHAWLETHSLKGVIGGAIEQVKFYYFAKQATYSSIFLMALFPGVLNERWYALTPFIMSGMIIGSLSALIHVILKDCMGIKDKYVIGLVNLIMLFLSIQTLLAPLEALYWYNGSLHYVFMQSVMYFETALILHYMHTDKRAEKIIILIAGSLLGIVVGGANLITGLQACLLIAIYAVIVILQIIAERKTNSIGTKIGVGRFNKGHLMLCIPMIVTIAGYMANILAPGNSKRATVEVQMNPIKAVIMSFEWGAIYTVSWTKPIVIIAFLIIAIIIWKYAGETKRNYMNPLLIAIISFCLFSAMLTPTFFATSADAPDRVKNIIGTALYMLYFVNIVNGFGYLANREKNNSKKEIALEKIFKILSADGEYIKVIIAGIILIMAIVFLQQDKNTFTSISAVRSIANGEAARYYSECVERIELFNDNNQPNITVKKLSDNAKPYLLFKEDLGNDGEEGYWQVVQICDFYDKTSVTVVP